MNELDRSLWEANRWVVAFRWFYLPGILLIGLIAQINNISLGNLHGPLVIAFTFGLIVLNLFFLFYLKIIQRQPQKNSLTFLSCLQIAAELIIFTGIFSLAGGLNGSGGAESIVPIMFFIPIVETAVLFHFWGPIIVSILSGVLINIIILFQEPGLMTQISQFLVQPSQLLPLAVVKGLNISIIYLIIGVFSSFISKLLKERSDLLAREAVSREGQIKNLQKLNQDLADVTRALSAKEFELTAANNRLQLLEEAKSKFVSVTTHQLRTPLAAIKWTFHLLFTGGLGQISDEQKEFIKKGLDSTERIIKIVNELLNIDFVESDKEKYTWQKVDLAQLLDAVKFEFTNQALSKKMTLEIVLPSRPAPAIMADPDKLRMVLENLTDNAIKYTKEGGTVKLIVDDSQVNTSRPQIIIKISDTGIGIAEKDQKRLFQKFFRAGSAVRQEPDGSGLGLFISKEIIEKHHGTIWFESKEGQGTIFYLSLPLNQT